MNQEKILKILSCWVVKRFLVYINFRIIFFFWSGLGLRKSLTFFILHEPYLQQSIRADCRQRDER